MICSPLTYKKAVSPPVAVRLFSFGGFGETVFMKTVMEKEEQWGISKKRISGCPLLCFAEVGIKAETKALK